MRRVVNIIIDRLRLSNVLSMMEVHPIRIGFVVAIRSGFALHTRAL